MKNNGKADTTIKWFSKALTAIGKHADLNNPEQVKQFIANKPATNGTKRNYCIAYAKYCQYHKIQWEMPRYKQKAQLLLIIRIKGAS